MQIDRDVDARGLNCPLPLMKAKKNLGEMRSGEVLRLVATDSASLRDFQTFAKQSGHELLSQESAGREITHILRCCR